MGTRTIDTIIRLQNESEYKTALKNITSEQKVLKSEMARVTSEFRTNANSMEALTAKGDVLGKMYSKQQEYVNTLRGALEKAQRTRDEEEQTVQALREQYEQAQKALKSFGDTVDKTSEEYQQQEAAVKKLRNEVIQHQAKLDSSSKSVNYYATQLNRAQVELDKLSDQQDENNRLLDEAKQSADGCAKSIDRYGDAVRESAEGSGEAGSAVERLADSIVASGIQQKVEEVAATLMECSEAAQTFEHSIAQVGTIADPSAMSLQDLRSGVLTLSTDLRKEAGEVSEAVYNALSAGVDTAGVLKFTAQSAQLATAGFTDMYTSVDVLTTILNAYKMETDQTEKVASTLVKTQDRGKVTVDQLGKVIGRVIPSAAAYNVNLDNIATAYANMTAAGINAENSTTYLSTMLDELADSGSGVAKILKEQTGKTFAELMAEGKSLGDVLDILGASVEYDNTQFSNLWSSSTAAKGAISLFDGSTEAFNTTLMEMANSSGTVAKNYEKMTEISEYSSQRFEVAAENLKITVGTQLNPVLDDLREAGAGAMELATEFVNDNPAVVACITGLVTSLGLLTAGLAGMTILKTITPLLVDFGAVLMANPAAIVAVSVAGLVAALGTLAAQVETTEERVARLTQASRDMEEAVLRGNDTFDDAVVASEAAASSAGQYIDRLDELAAQGLDTAETQARYAANLEIIKTLIPGINVEIDEQTGLVKGGTDALRDQVKAWEENAVAEAAYARYKDGIAALTAAEYELAKNKAKLVALEEREKPIREAMTRVSEEMKKAQDRLNQSTSSATNYLGANTKEQKEAQQQVDALSDEFYNLARQLEETSSESRALGQAVADGEQAVADAKGDVEAATVAWNELSGSINQVTESTDANAESAQAAGETAVDAATTIRDAYAEMYASARESLDKQIGLFDDLSGKCEQSTEDMIKALQSQKKAFEDYATNIQVAVDRGIDMGLVQQLSDGSEESMRILAELVTASNDQIDELNAAFAGVSEAKNSVATEMAGVELAVAQAMEDAAVAAEQGGENVVDGIIAGLRNRRPALDFEIRAIAYGMQDAYAEANDSHSPSRKYQELASYETQGVLLQYKLDKPKLEQAASNLANAGYAASAKARLAQIPSMLSAASTPKATDLSHLYGLLQQMLTALKGRQALYLNGNLVGETVDDYDMALGQNRMLSERGAK